jgi:hypothetical protein
VNAWADLAVVFGLGGVLSIALYLSYRAGTGFLVLAACFAVFADFPHVLQTSVRVWLDPLQRRRYGRHYLVSLAAIATAVVLLNATGQFAIVLAVFVTWQVMHVVRQHVGMVSIYASKGGYRGSRGPAKRLMIAGCLAPVLYRAADGLRLGHYVLGGRPLPFSGMTVPLPPIPRFVVWLAYGAFLVTLVLFVGQQLLQYHRHETGLPAVALLTIAVALVFYNASYHLVADPYALILIATTFHSLQYHLISWARNRGRFTRDAAPGEQALLLARLSCPRAVGLVLLALAVPSALLSAGEFVLLGAVPFSLVLHHFYLDGVLWKPRHDSGLVTALALR